MRVGVLFSGGKDSTFAYHWAVLHGFEVSCLITLRPKSTESWMFHYPCIDLTQIQAEAIELPQIFVETSGEKDVELQDLKRALEEAKSKFKIKGLVTGALLSDYQRMNINIVCEEVGLRTYSPLWRKDQEQYMRDLIEFGFKIVITSINVMGLDPSLIGKVLTSEDVEKIIQLSRKFGFNPAFEGGEAETLVIDAPLFKKRIEILDYEIVKETEYSWRMHIKKVKLVPKYC